LGSLDSWRNRKVTLKLALPLIPSLLAVLAAAACFGGAPSDPRRLVPSDANVIAEVRVADLLKDPDLVRLYDSAPKKPDDPQTFDELLSTSVVKIGLDVRAITSAVVFSDAGDAEEYTGAILQGRFEAAALLSRLRATNPGASETTYKERQVYLATPGNTSQAYTLLSNDLLVAGTLPAVQRVIDVHQGDLPAISGPVWDSFQSLGTPLFRMAAEVPPDALAESSEALDDVPGLGGMPLGLEALNALTLVGFALDKTGPDVKMHAQLEFRDAGSADQMEGMLSGALSLLRGFSQDRQLRDLLDQIQVKLTDVRLDITAQATVAQLEALADKAGGLR
jgi:hypothetical protein